jgi:hypothetical protein
MRRGRINEWQRQRHGIVKNPFGPDDKLFRRLRTDLKDREDLAFDRWKPLRRTALVRVNVRLAEPDLIRPHDPVCQNDFAKRSPS